MITKLKEYIKKIDIERNIKIDRIVADVLSVGGEHIANKFDMKYICDSKHGSKIYEYVG